MRKIHFILFSFFICIISYAQQPEATQADRALNTDSIYHLVTQNISVKEKREIINHSGIGLTPIDTEGQSRILNHLLQESKNIKDIENIFFSYCKLANIHFSNRTVAKDYLDSAKVYANQSKNTREIAFFHYLSGFYTLNYHPANSKDGYNDFYQSLYFYEQLGDNPKMVIYIILALASEASVREDTVSIKNILNKAITLNKQIPDDTTLEFLINELNCIQYKINYKEYPEERLIDSILHYEKKSIRLYESGKTIGSIIDLNIKLIYTHIAEYEAMREHPDFSLIDDCLIKAQKLLEKQEDPIVKIRILYAQSWVSYARKELKQAERQALHVNELIDNYRHFGYQQLYIDNFNLLSRIQEAKGDFKTAMEYDNLKSKYELEIRNNEIKTIELQFATDKKEAEVVDLKTKNAFHQKTKPFFIAICILLSITTLLLILLFSAKQKSLREYAALEKKAKDDAKLKLKLKEEQAKKETLKKYEVLSDFHLKEMELIGKSKELEQLEHEKRELDKQVERFAEKIAEYECSMQMQQTDQKDLSIYTIVKEDIEQLICKHACDTADYIQNLNIINETYVGSLKEKHEGPISVQYIKYCVCFAIGMEIQEVAACFSIEQASVHGLRYRLKKKFRLGPDDNLELFLKSLIPNTALSETTD